MRRPRTEPSPIQPDILHPPPVVYAVGIDRQTLHRRIPAHASAVELDERLRVILQQAPLYLPDDLAPPILVAFHRLLVNQDLDLFVAVGIVIAEAVATEILV